MNNKENKNVRKKTKGKKKHEKGTTNEGVVRRKEQVFKTIKVVQESEMMIKYLKMLQIENTYNNDRQYLKQQKYINQEHRECSIDYMCKLQKKFSLKIETVFTGVFTLDTYLSKLPETKVKELQGITLCCLHLANKYQEIYPVSFQRLKQALNDSIDISQVRRLELTIFSTLKCRLPVSTLNIFLSRLVCILSMNNIQIEMAFQLGYKCLLVYELMAYKSSLLAASIVLLVYQIQDKSNSCSKKINKIYNITPVMKELLDHFDFNFSEQSEQSE